jgi:hypothetical protein
LDFKQYVRKNGGYIARKLAARKGFPMDPTFKDLRTYMLGMNLPGPLQTEFENLHDQYELDTAAKTAERQG